MFDRYSEEYDDFQIVNGGSPTVRIAFVRGNNRFHVGDFVCVAVAGMDKQYARLDRIVQHALRIEDDMVDGEDEADNQYKYPCIMWLQETKSG